MSPARTKELEAGRRPDVEAQLSDKFNVGWEFIVNMPTTEFDIEVSLKNQARFEAIDENTVEQYYEAVQRGDHFPGVIAYRRTPKGKLIIVDGNHRLVAHDRAGVPLDVYVIAQGTRAETIALMTFSFNTTHGRPTSEAERVTQAIYLIDNGANLAQASEAVNLPERIVRREVNKANADKRADEVGLDRREWEALAQSVRSRMLSVTTDEGFLDACRLAFAARLNAEEAFELVSLVNQSRSASKQRALIKTQRAHYQDRIQEAGSGVFDPNRKGRTPGPKQRIGMALGQVMSLPEDVMAIAKLYADAERESAATMVMDASNRLRKIALVLDDKVK